MPLDFPSSPTNGQVYDQWQWDGSKWVAIVGTLPAGPAGPQGIPGAGSIAGMTAGQIPIAASATAISSSANLSGDVTSNATLVTTLATVNANVGSFQGLTLNAKGLVTAAVNQSYAPLASPTFSGTPTLPTGTIGVTQTAGNNTTAVATTAFVATAGGAFLPLSGSVPMTGGLTVNAAATPLTVNSNAAALPALATAQIHAGAPNGVSALVALDSFGTVYPEFRGRMARGTAAVPTATQLNDTMALFSAFGWQGGNYSLAGQMYWQASENWTATAHGTVLQFSTTQPGTLTTTYPMSIGQGAMVGVGADPGVGSLRASGTVYAAFLDIRQAAARGLNVTAPASTNSEIGITCTGATHTWVIQGDSVTPAFKVLDNATSRFVIDGTGICYNTTGTWTAISDVSLKENVADYTTSLSAIRQLRPVTFSWVDETLGPRQNWGLIAQEVESVMPELVGEIEMTSGRLDAEPQIIKTVDYGRAIFAVINALKEVSERLDAIEARLPPAVH